MNHDTNITLSILIPAFNYSYGVSRVLKKLKTGDLSRVEIIISDDSSNNEVMNVVNKFKDINIEYINHKPSGNAVDNWNFLLKKAKGKYLQFIHHDEFPISENYIEILLDLIDSKNPDLIITNCYLKNNYLIKKFTPSFIKKLVLKFPYFLIHKNVYGSPSNFIFLNSANLSFDRDLIYLVDVDAYIKLIQHSSYTYLFEKQIMISEIDKSISITSKIRESLPQIIDVETKILTKRHVDMKINIFLIMLLKKILYASKFIIYIISLISPKKLETND